MNFFARQFTYIIIIFDKGSAASEGQTSDGGVVVALALVIAVSVTAILALTGTIIFLKK